MARNEGYNPTTKDRAAMVDRAVALYHKFPAGGAEFAARRVASDVGLGEWRSLAADVAGRIEDE